ncbi:MAG: XrtA/PEP-CTERM system histidine kinase PrsK [Verrucomicrobiota bacterium]|jgi:putative PEP-CTERM system histidine kinase
MNAVILDYSAAFLGGAVALIAAFRERRSVAVWFFVAGMALLSCESVFSGLMTGAVSPEEAGRWEDWALLSMSLLPGVWLLFSLSYARGNYREFLGKWREALGAAFIVPIALAVWHRGQLVGGQVFLSATQQWLFALTPTGWVAYMISLLGAVVILMQLERTFWASVGTMRWRIKFMVLGLGLLFAVRAYTASQALVLPTQLQIRDRMIPVTGPTSSAATVNAAALLLGCLLMLRSLFRGSAEVAVYPSHKDLHKSVTLLVAGLYLLIVGVLAKVVQWLRLTGSFQLRAFFILVVLVVVTVLLLSDRVQLHTRRLVSRYLQRPLYDYRTVWRRFTEGMASRVTQKELCQASVKLAADIFQALSVSIWLMDDKGENLELAASTSLSAAMAEKLRPSREEAAELIQAMRHRLEPVDVEYSSENWAVTLRRCHPSEFEEGGGRVCVPMVAGGELLGLMILGDRVAGLLFSLQDYDLLKCVGDQIAASLLNSQLSQKLLQAKELEAFQTMSAFFVHDLKNTASTLNLMLQNLPVHFDNPAFREDALRGIAKSGRHINHLIGRLSVLRHDLQIHPEVSDLNDLVSKILASWNGSPALALASHLGPIPQFPFDSEQIHKVVTNLLLNAAQAVGPNGQIRVQTSQAQNWVVLTVADNGCGMAPEFLRGALFRPFQTTKKDGFGIGMFQSKMIVEAHGGRIEVESQLNKGTSFRVLLPASKNSR